MKRDPEFSKRVQASLVRIRALAVRFHGAKGNWIGVIPGRKVGKGILNYLEDHANTLSRKGGLPAKFLKTEDGRRLAQHYQEHDGPEIKAGLMVYEITADPADLTAMAANAESLTRFSPV